MELELPPEFCDPPVDGTSDELGADDIYDAADPRAVNAAKKRASRERLEDLSVITEIMNSSRGRKWMYRWLERRFIFDNPFVPNDPYSGSFNMGMQNSGKETLIDVMEASPDNYVLMLKENKFNTK